MSKETIGKYRWVIATLLLFATTINYMDRQVISYLKEFFCTPKAKGGFGWTNTDYSDVTSFFTLFYAGMTVFAGWFIDKIGTKLGLALSLIVWSIFGILNAFAGSLVAVHMAIRSLFGIGEGGNFPASIKTVAEWFPKKERALATGLGDTPACAVRNRAGQRPETLSSMVPHPVWAGTPQRSGARYLFIRQRHPACFGADTLSVRLGPAADLAVRNSGRALQEGGRRGAHWYTRRQGT